MNELTEGIDFVFHQAALRITRCAEAPREAVDVLINGTLNVLESAVHHKVKKVMAASSASVYGDPSYLPMDENHPFNNRTMYGAGKMHVSRCCGPITRCTVSLHCVSLFQRVRAAHGHHGRIHGGLDPLAGCDRSGQAAPDFWRWQLNQWTLSSSRMWLARICSRHRAI